MGKQKSYIDNTLHLYLIIKSFMNFNNVNTPFCFPSVYKLQLYSGLSKQSVLNTISTLENMNLIYQRLSMSTTICLGCPVIIIGVNSA